MTASLKSIKVLFVKDLLIEVRSRRLLPVAIMLGLLISWIFRLAAGAELADKSVFAITALLIVVLFSAILTSQRSFDIEKENNCIGALLLSPVGGGDIYLAKTAVNIVMLCIFEIVIIPSVFLLFNISTVDNWFGLVLALLLFNIGVSGVGTLLAGMIHGTKASSSLLSVLILAVLCPMMIPAVSALLAIFGSADSPVLLGQQSGLSGTLQNALCTIAAFDAIFITAGWLLFDFITGD